MKIAHTSGQACGWVTEADQPPALATPNVMVTPRVKLARSAEVSDVYDWLS